MERQNVVHWYISIIPYSYVLTFKYVADTKSLWHEYQECVSDIAVRAFLFESEYYLVIVVKFSEQR